MSRLTFLTGSRLDLRFGGLRLWMLMSLFWLSLGEAQASPVMDRETERVLYQSGMNVEAVGIGTYLSTERGLTLTNASSAKRINYWLPHDDTGFMDSGLVRARFRLGDRPDFTLLARVQVPGENREEINAVGLSLSRTGVALYRYDLGVPKPISSFLSIKSLSEGREVEVVMYLVGPFLSAHVYDAKSLSLLGSLTANIPGIESGYTGLRTYRRSDTKTTMTYLSVSNSFPAQERDPSMFGTERLIELKGEDSARIEEAAAGSVIRSEFKDGQEHVWTVTDLLGEERLLRLGVEPISVTGHVPFWTRDQRYISQMGQPPVETDKGYDLDLSYKDAEMVEDLLEAYHRKYPHISSLHVIGTTHHGRKILALRITDNPTKNESEPAILLNAAHHGGELLSTEYALDAMQTLLEGYRTNSQIRRWVNQLDIWLVPLVNPDGNWNYMQGSHHAERKNGRDTNGDGVYEFWEGVDLNRNYPFHWGEPGEVASRSWHRNRTYRGPHPGSEPEVQAIMDLANTYHFAASISWHTSATKVLTPYTIDGVRNIEPDIPALIIEPIVKKLPTQPNGRRFKMVRKLYSVDGVDQDWHFHTHGTLAYLLEGSHFNTLNWDTAQASIKGAHPFFEMVLDRVVDGPMIYGEVVDESGWPLEAVITIDEVKTFEGEIWTSRASDGRFDRMLHKGGRYTVRAVYEGTEIVQELDVKETGWTEVTLVVPTYGDPDMRTSALGF